MQVLKLPLYILLLISISIGCTESNSLAETTEITSDSKTELITGGLYASINSDGSFGISKLLVIEEKGVHVRMYNESFSELPENISSSELTFFIGHAPMAKAQAEAMVPIIEEFLKPSNAMYV